ncbi:MAG: adenylate/guanylate cyclase domain-containing protein [Dehalococcoidia bacterium]
MQGRRRSSRSSRASRGVLGERRVITALFCDVTGSTTFAEQLDPEEWTEIMNEAFDYMIQPVVRYEGTVARLIGEGILAFFGAPLAAQIAKESEKACHAKVEVAPTARRVAEANRLGGDDLIIFGGAGGNFFIEELRRGAVGTMPFACVPEMFRKVWDLYQDGKEAEAIQEFDRFVPLLKTLGQGMGKEVLRLRGVFKTVNVRHPASPPDDRTFNEMRTIVERLELTPASVA